MKFRILGSLEAFSDDGIVPLGGMKPRALLANLLLNANEPVSSEALAIALWGDDAAGRAVVKTVQVHVSRLRKALGEPGIVATTRAGYRLRLGPDDLDAACFARLVDEGRAALADDDPVRAGIILREALGLWRGPALRTWRSSRSPRSTSRASTSSAWPRSKRASRPISRPARTPSSSAICTSSCPRTRPASA